MFFFAFFRSLFRQFQVLWIIKCAPQKRGNNFVETIGFVIAFERERNGTEWHMAVTMHTRVSEHLSFSTSKFDYIVLYLKFCYVLHLHPDQENYGCLLFFSSSFFVSYFFCVILLYNLSEAKATQKDFLCGFWRKPNKLKKLNNIFVVCVCCLSFIWWMGHFLVFYSFIHSFIYISFFFSHFFLFCLRVCGLSA